MKIRSFYIDVMAEADRTDDLARAAQELDEDIDQVAAEVERLKRRTKQYRENIAELEGWWTGLMARLNALEQGVPHRDSV